MLICHLLNRDLNRLPAIPIENGNDLNYGCDELQAVSESSVLRKLSALNPTKAKGPDGIPAWLLKENADFLAGPVTV